LLSNPLKKNNKKKKQQQQQQQNKEKGWQKPVLSTQLAHNMSKYYLQSVFHLSKM